MQKESKTYIVDIDGTICTLVKNGAYEKALPNKRNIARINHLFNMGNKIIYWTARGATTGIDWTDVTKNQLKNWNVKYHELKMGKPHYDVWIDDKAVTFENLPHFPHPAENESERAHFYRIDRVPAHNKLRYEIFSNYCKGKKVADISCGCGYGSYILSGVSEVVYGFDYSEKAIDFCKTYWSNDNIKYEVMNINNITTNEKFDVIVHSETIEHIKTPINQTLKILSGLLRPDGILCITHPENEPKGKAAPGHVHFNIKRSQMESILKSMGFKIIQSKEYTKAASMIVAQKEKV